MTSGNVFVPPRATGGAGPHDHDGVYSPVAHGHDLTHEHDDEYSALNHGHAVAHGDLTGVTADQHHTQAHSQTDHPAPGIPSTSRPGDTAAVGSSTAPANADHVHGGPLALVNVTEAGTGASTAFVSLLTSAIPPSALEAGRAFRFVAWGTRDGGISSASVRLILNTITLGPFSLPAAGPWRIEGEVAADGSQTAQKWCVHAGSAAGYHPPLQGAGAVDMTVSRNLVVQAQTLNATDEVTCEALLIDAVR